MANITTRQTPGGTGVTNNNGPLSNAQLDTNFINLNTELTGVTSSKPANTIYAAPNGSAGAPTFRAIVAADVPTLNQSTTGNAGTATAWQTPRTLTIGNTGKSVDGSAAVGWSLAEIGAYAATNPSGYITSSASITGNAGTATTWQTARTLTIGNTGKNVDGSAAVSWSLAEIGALPLAGGVLTGSIKINTSGSTSSTSHFIIKRSGAAEPGTFGSYSGSWRSGIEIWNNDSTKMLFLNPPENDSSYANIKSVGGGFFVDVGSSGGTRAIQIESSGAANFPVGLAHNGNAVLTTGNYNSYALPLSGGTMSGPILMQGTQRITNAGFAGIEYWNNGAWQVFIGSENNAAGSRFNAANGVHTWYNNSTQTMQLSGSALTVTGLVTAPNFADSTGSYNVNLGSGGTEGRGLVAGYSGGWYGGIGYNVRHTASSGVIIAPLGDTSSYLAFSVGGFNFYGAAGGAVGRTLDFSTPLATLGLSGAFNTLGAITQSGNQVLHAGNYNSYSPTLTGGGASGTWSINVTGTAAGETFSTVSTRGNSYINPSSGGISIGETFANYDGWNTQLNVHGGPHSRITVKTDTVRMGIYAHNTWQSVNGVTPGGFVGTYNNYPLSILVNSAQRMVFNTSGNIGIATDDFSYTTSDSTPVIGSITNNRLFINGSIQLIGSNDAIVFGRNTSTFLKDEELGFGWGGGWYMNDATWIRARNDKNIITGGSLTVGGNIRQGNNIARPLSQWSASGTATGMVFFELPGTTSNYGMVHMVFDIYEYDSNSVSTVIVGGHNWAGGWYNLASNVIGQTNKQVRLGTRGGKYVVCFGTAGSTWSYGTVILRKIHNGGYYDNIIDMNAQFVANITTSESLTWDSGDLRALRTPSSFNAIGAITQNGNQVLHASNYNSYALPLSGGTITSNLNIDGTLGFRRGSGDYSTYIKANGYPAQGYANADGSKYWVEIGAAGGVHVILNTDGAANSAENSYDHFTVWQNSNTGTRLFHVTNGGNAVISGSLTVGGKIQRSAAGAGYLDGGYAGVETTNTSGAIYSIGGSYVPGTTNLGNMYGIGYSYSGYAMGNPGGVATNRWGMYVASAGVARIFLDSDDGSGYFAGGVVANSIRLNQERALNARIYSASAGSMGLLGVDSNNAYRWQIYGTGTEYGFLNGVWAGWDLRKNVNGELLVTVSGAERTVLHAGNYNSYSPTLTGGGASGTWGISISGSAAQLNGYASSENGGGSVILRTASNGYLYVNNWINTNAGGIFSSVNSAHFYPNNSNEYGSWRISGTLNGWHGIYFDSGSNLMMNSSEVGFHRAGHGWQMRWSGGTGYINKGNPGGGTQATILDSSNYNSYSPTLTGGGASGTWGINVTGSAGSVAWTNVSGKPTSFGLSKAQVYFFCSF